MRMDQDIPPVRRLMTLRIIWAALLMGQLAFLGIVLMIGPNQPAPDPQMLRILLYVLIAMAATMIPIGFVIRGIIYNNGRTEAGVAPAQYAVGNILFWAMCEGVGLFGITAGLLNRGRGPHLIVAVIALAIMIVSFPTGGVMRRD